GRTGISERFFFSSRRRHTRCLSDWSSDVCSSDLHESGHTIVAAILPAADPLHKVTIIPRGRALGLTQQLPTEDKYSYSKRYLDAMLAVLMGGRIAEEVFVGELTTGAGNDIERATTMARRMVCEWGMSDLG